MLLDNVAVQECYVSQCNNRKEILKSKVYTKDTPISTPGYYVTDITNYLFVYSNLIHLLIKVS